MSEVFAESRPHDILRDSSGGGASSPSGSLTPTTRMALKRSALRRSLNQAGGSGLIELGVDPDSLKRESSSTFSIPPPPTDSSVGSSGARRYYEGGGSGVVEIPPPPSPFQLNRSLSTSSRGDEAMVVSPTSAGGSKRHFGKLQEVVLRPTPRQTARKQRWAADGIHARGWDNEHAPTSNPFLVRAMLEGEREPWKNRAMYLMTAHQMSTVVEGLYSSTRSLHAGITYRPLPLDCVVCGVPRAGLNPIVQALESLRQGRPIAQVEELVGTVPWLEGAYTTDAMIHGKANVSRVVRTHLPLHYGLGGESSHAYFAKLYKTFRTVVVLRDPVDVRLCWFRHVRRVFNKYNPTLQFDQHFSLDDFAKVTRGAIQPSMAAMFDMQDDYEHFVRKVLLTVQEQVRDPTHILVVFYEELLVAPLSVVKKLAAHSGFGLEDDALLLRVAEMLGESTLHPKRELRKGSSGQGRQAFTQRSVDYIDTRWLDLVKPTLKDYCSYEQLFEKITNTPYPFKAPPVPVCRASFTLFNSKPSESSSTVSTSAAFSTNDRPPGMGAKKRSSMLDMLRGRRRPAAKSDEASTRERCVPDPDDSDSDLESLAFPKLRLNQ